MTYSPWGAAVLWAQAFVAALLVSSPGSFQRCLAIPLWVGTARQGKGASKGSAKGKGAGAAVAERYPKAKTKGKKW